MRRLAILLALACAQPAQAMPNDPDVVGLELAHAILPDALKGMQGCLVAKLEPTPEPVSQIPARLWIDGVQLKPLTDAALVQPIVSANLVATPIPADMIDEDELHVMFPKARFDDGSAQCRTTIQMTLPRIAGDWAFVAVGRQCGPTCGTGILFAYRREHGRWRRKARALAWMS